ncbi:MAG: hypothetical protein BGO29_01970 [Bacteroidales bacterium 36-12]|nr:MAG: hypothetical protein BGO29_01970 [Bacteroidales bacterium 36-12]
MEPLQIQIVNLIGDVYAVEAEDGQKIFNSITKAFTDKQKVNISFQNIEMLTTAFLNTAVGQLYKDYTEEFIKENLSVSDISDSGIVSLKRVVDTAKLYFKDPEAMQHSINEILED